MSDAYLEHFGVKGMRWGVRKDDQGYSKKEVNRDAKTRQKAQQSSFRRKVSEGRAFQRTVSGGKALRAINSEIAAKNKKNPGYAEAVDQRENVLNRRRNLAILGTVLVTGIALTHQDQVISGAKIAAEVISTVAKEAPDYIDKVNKGKAFANSMGLAGPTYVNPDGRILKNVRPNFG